MTEIEYMELIGAWVDDLRNKPDVHHTAVAQKGTLVLKPTKCKAGEPGFVCAITKTDALLGFTSRKWNAIQQRLILLKQTQQLE